MDGWGRCSGMPPRDELHLMSDVRGISKTCPLNPVFLVWARVARDGKIDCVREPSVCKWALSLYKERILLYHSHPISAPLVD